MYIQPRVADYFILISVRVYQELGYLTHSLRGGEMEGVEGDGKRSVSFK